MGTRRFSQLAKLLVVGALWAGYAGLVSTTRFTLQNTTIERLEGTPQAISLPFRDTRRTEPARYRISGLISPPATSKIKGKPQIFRIIPDDCLESLSVGGLSVDLSTLPSGARCDWQRGFTLDLSRYLAPEGKTTFTVEIRNLSGPVGFQISSPGFSVTDALLTPLPSNPAPVQIPFTRETDPSAMSYLVRGQFSRGTFGSNRVTIVADDCLNELTIEGKPVDLTPFTRAQLCDWRMGVTLDLKTYLPTSGPSQFTLTMTNIAGPYGLSLRPAPSVMTTLLDGLGIILLFFTFSAILAMLALTPVIPAALLTIGTTLRYDIIFRLHRAEEHAFSDAENYLRHALAIVRGHFWIGQTFQGIGYPVLLAGAFKMGGENYYTAAYSMQLIATVLTVALGWRATARLLGERRGIWALVILTFHVPFLSMAGFFMAETLFGLGMAALFYLLVRFPFPWSGPAGFAIGAVHMASAALKGLNGFFAPLFLLWSFGHAARLGLFSGARRDPRLLWRRLLAPLTAVAIGALAIALPQGLAMSKYYGTFQLSAPTGALNLVEGKCPSKLNRDSTGAYWLSPLFAQLGETKEKVWPRPFTDQAYFWHAGFDCIRENPAVLLTSFRYVYFLFFGNDLWPANMTRFKDLSHKYSLLFALLFAPGIAVGLGRAFRQPFATRALPFLPLLAILVCAWALKSEMRYRVPFDSAFIAAGIAGWSWIFARPAIAQRFPEWAPTAALLLTTLGLATFVGFPILTAT